MADIEKHSDSDSEGYEDALESVTEELSNVPVHDVPDTKHEKENDPTKEHINKYDDDSTHKTPLTSQSKCSTNDERIEQNSDKEEEQNALLHQDDDEDDESENGSSAENDSDDKFDPVDEFVKEAIGDAKTEKELEDDTKAQEEKPIVIDEDAIRQEEAKLTDEEREERRQQAQSLKDEGNHEFKSTNFDNAYEKFTEALAICPMCFSKERSIMYSNRGACRYRQEKYESCIEDSSKAIELNPNYLKALIRRAECYEKTDKLDEALEDYNRCLEMDPSLPKAREACRRLPDQINERNEKLKEEMLGKLKDLGNMVLRPFGLSTNNFQLNQNPSGGYSVNFSQNPDNGNKKS